MISIVRCPRPRLRQFHTLTALTGSNITTNTNTNTNTNSNTLQLYKRTHLLPKHSNRCSNWTRTTLQSTSTFQPLHSNLHIQSIGYRTIMSSSAFPVTANLTTKLTEAFEPSHLEVINESHMHNVPAASESHFKVIIVSSLFDTAKTPLARHRMVNKVLSQELANRSDGGSVHALSIVAKTPKQWTKMMDAKGIVAIDPSPSCRGGDGSLPPKHSN